MPRLAFPVLALALGAALAVGIASCGADEEGLLPGDNAQQIVDNLNDVEQEVENQDCDAAADNAAEVQDQIESLGDEVNARLKQRLEEGAEQLVVLVEEQCAEATAPIETTPTETTTKETTTEPEETTTTTTTTTPTTTTQTTTPTSPIVPPETGTGGGVVPPGQSSGPGGGDEGGEG